jgi:N-acetylglucosaminyldiphosphoundecaprenol N-acetyl-beta-D-mannosaminyltransferase
MDKISILGIAVDNPQEGEIAAKIKEFLSDGHQHFVVTPNPEIVLEANRDEEFFYILNSADLSLGDGVGLKLASWLSGVNLSRIVGADFTSDLLKLAEIEGRKVGVLLWENGLSSKEDVEAALKNAYDRLNFNVIAAEREVDAEIDQAFIDFQPEILFVAFGFPWQEKFIFHNLGRIPSVKIAIGIGGTFDFLTGKRKRASKFLRSIGLEWLWRLLIQPQRFARIFNAVAVFSWNVFKSRFITPLLYRPNVICLLYKKESDQYKILLVQRREDPNHWQLPQGGTDGESLLIAGARETREELNTDKFISKRVYKNIYQYKFPNNSNVGGRGKTFVSRGAARHNYKGQKQGLFIAEFTGRDEDIKVNYWDHTSWKWVDAEKLVDEVHFIRKRSAHKFLKKFKEFAKIK